MTQEEFQHEATLWRRLDGHNEFITSRIKNFSKSAHENNKDLGSQCQAPSWNDASF